MQRKGIVEIESDIMKGKVSLIKSILTRERNVSRGKADGYNVILNGFEVEIINVE